MSKRFLLPCACGKKLVVDATQAGEQLRCECGTSVLVPTLRGLKDLEPVDEPTEGPAGRRSVTTSSGRTLGSDLAFAACLFLLIVSVVALIPLTLVWLRLDTSFNMEADVSYGNEQIDLLPVDQSWEVWKEFRNTGLRVGDVPFYTRILQYATVFSRVILGLSIVAILSILGLVISGRISSKARAARRASLVA
jgi:hypothetical protein